MGGKKAAANKEEIQTIILGFKRHCSKKKKKKEEDKQINHSSAYYADRKVSLVTAELQSLMLFQARLLLVHLIQSSSDSSDCRSERSHTLSQ